MEVCDQRLENERNVNGHIVEPERKELEESMENVTQMKTEIFVETFPLRPALKTDDIESDMVLTDEEVEAIIADAKSDTSFECLNGSAAEKSLQVDVLNGIDLESKGDLPVENQVSFTLTWLWNF